MSELVDYAIRDIVKTDDAHCNRELVIVEVDQQHRAPYLAVPRRGKRRQYRLLGSEILVRIGQVDENDPILHPVYDSRQGQEFALEMASKEPARAELWRYLASLQPDDKILVVHHNKIHEANFVALNSRSPRFAVTAKLGLKRWSFPLESIVLP